MITFTPDGHYVITANEGEPNDRYTVDPAGSVSIIDLGKGIEALRQKDVLTLDFSMFEGKPLPQYVRIATPGEPLVKDFEPEYIAVNADSTKAWVSLQENNAIGEIDLTSKKIVSLFGLSYTDHSAPGNFLDASDKDDSFNLRSWPVRGLPMPDAIATYQVAGVNFLITANEGDPRDYSAWSEVARVENLKLDEESFPNAADLQKKEKLGRLKVTTTLGDEDKDGKYEYLYSFGSRSFSIYKEDGQKVYDSGEFFGKYLALNFPEKAKDLDGRSDDKGSEPEGLVIGKINERTIAFIGLERAGGVFVFDVSKPETPIFQCYLDAPMLPGKMILNPRKALVRKG